MLGALVQDQLFRFLRPVVYLHPTGVRKPGIGFAMHHQQRARCQLPRQVCAVGLRRSRHDARHMIMQYARSNDHGAAKRVPDKDHRLRAARRQIGDPGHDVQRTFRQNVGMTVTQPQGRDPVPTQPFREPRLGAVARPAEAPPGATHPDHPVLRFRGLMQDRLDVAPVRPEQHPLVQLAFVGRAGMHVVDADGEGLRVVLARLTVRRFWHVTPPPGV